MEETSAQVVDAFRGLLRLRSFSQELEQLEAGRPRIEEEAFLSFCYRHCHDSRAQLFQDLFVAYQLREKLGGFFVEFGATNGVDLSNTCLLEKNYGWHGILAEPARIWQESLRANRNCIVDNRCVWEQSGEELLFNETPFPELSTIESLSATDEHASARANGKRYLVQTISLNDLLAAHAAPRRIEYLSIDTEGSELSILRALDFERYCVEVITVEHNFMPARDQIHSLLASKGYLRKFEAFSQWDDWYVKT
jgi:FkbM family methyltransferase